MPKKRSKCRGPLYHKRLCDIDEAGKTSKWFLFNMVFVEMVLVFVDMVLVFVDMVLVLFIMVLVFVDMVFNNLFQPYLK